MFEGEQAATNSNVGRIYIGGLPATAAVKFQSSNAENKRRKQQSNARTTYFFARIDGNFGNPIKWSSSSEKLQAKSEIYTSEYPIPRISAGHDCGRFKEQIFVFDRES